MLNVAKESAHDPFKKNASYVCSSIEDFNSEKKFELIICFGVLAHVEDASIIFEKFTKLLNEKGTLYIQFTNWNNLLAKIISLKKLFRKRQNYESNRTTIKEIDNLIKLNRLCVLKRYSYFPVLPFMTLFSENQRFRLLKFLYNSWLSRFGSEIILEINLQTKSGLLAKNN